MVPLRVELVQLPDQRGPYQEYFGVPPSIGSVNRIAFSARDAQQPFLTESAAMWDFFEAGLSEKLSNLDTQASMTRRVRSALQEMLPGGQSSIEEAANRLAVPATKALGGVIQLPGGVERHPARSGTLLSFTVFRLAHRNCLFAWIPGWQLVYPRI
jgi:hypothetical protein